MTRRTTSTLLPTLLGCALAASAVSALPPDDGASSEKNVHARLVSSVESVAAGQPFRLGVEILMDDGWHTYWENGGDAGLPTTIEWDLPEGFHSGKIRWPAPTRFEEEGDLVTFGYSDSVLLQTEITPPDVLPEGPITIAAQVDWLQCKELCIPGGQRVSIGLPAETTARSAPESVRARFTAADKRVPVAATSLPQVSIQAFQSFDAIPVGGHGEVALVLTGLDGARPEESVFLPRPSEVVWVREASFRSDGENFAVVIPVEVDAAVSPDDTIVCPVVLEIARQDGEPWIVSADIPVVIAAESHPARATDSPVFRGDGDFLAAGAAAGAPTSDLGLARYLLFAFLGGIVLNVMPCVLPVVSLKILGFVSQAAEDSRKVFRLGLAFAAGVLVSFALLAVAVIILQRTGEQVGWGFQFQNPTFVALLTAVVFTFALSLMGTFEIGFFPVLFPLLFGASAVADKKPYLDAFLNGVLATVLATPGTAPLLGTAIAFAFSQSAFVILLVFLTVGAGLAFPYVLISMHTAWLRYLPKPGRWMETFKQAMGFVLFATVIWLCSVFGALTGSGGLVWMLAFLLVVSFLAWLHGRFHTITSGRLRNLSLWAVTIVGVILAYHYLLGRALDATAYAHESGARTADVSAGGIVWEPFTLESLDAAVADGQTVFLDFTAEWCWTCKVNEKVVLADADVEESFRRNGVVTLKGDWTRKDPVITQILQEHGRAGVPFYAVYPANRPGEVIVLPELINKKLVLDSLERAGPSRASST